MIHLTHALYLIIIHLEEIKNLKYELVKDWNSFDKTKVYQIFLKVLFSSLNSYLLLNYVYNSTINFK